MQESKNGKLFALIGAICFTAYVAYSVINGFYVASIFEDYPITWERVVWWAVYIVLAVLLYLKKKNIALLIPSALSVIMGVYYLTEYVSFYNFMYFIMNVLLFILLLINVIPSMKNSVGVTRVLCFIPAVLYFAITLYEWIRWEYFRNILGLWIHMLFMLVEGVGYLFLGLWLKATMPVPEMIVEKNPYATFNPQVTVSQAQQHIGGADKLKMYKDLLDSGVITQEEFDAKKKQILGL